MVFVKGGTFIMGCTSEQGSDCDADEKPVHQVTLGDFHIGKYEVTQQEWQEVMGSNPSDFKNCDQCPVEKVSWDDIQQFLTRLKAKNGKTYRLPTEAEWEYAARGEASCRGYKYAGGNEPGNVAWYGDNSGSKAHPVGQKKANELGLHDMSGNGWEWCQDWYGDYSSEAQNNPKGPGNGDRRVLRGGLGGSRHHHRQGPGGGHAPGRGPATLPQPRGPGQPPDRPQHCLRREDRRCGIPAQRHAERHRAQAKDMHHVDSTDFCAIQGPYGYKWPKLSELHFKLFRTHFEEAHNAAVDIAAPPGASGSYAGSGSCERPGHGRQNLRSAGVFCCSPAPAGQQFRNTSRSGLVGKGMPPPQALQRLSAPSPRSEHVLILLISPFVELLPVLSAKPSYFCNEEG